MAQLLNTDQDKEKQQPMESQPSLAGGQQASEIGGNQTPTPAAPQQQGSSRESGSGSGMGQRFQNLKKYIEGNQGSNLAQKVTGDIAKQQKQTAEALKKSQEGLQQKVGQEQQRLQSGQKLVGTGEGDLNLLGGQGKAEMFTTNTPPPTTVPTNDPTQTVTPQPQVTEIEPVEPVQPEIKAPDFSEYGQTAEERLKAFQDFQVGKTRDIDFEDRFDRQQDIENLKRRTDLTQTEEGRFQLLRDVFKRPDYSTGQQRLDQLLLQASPEQRELLNQYKDVTNPLQEQLSGIESQLQTDVTGLQQQAQGLAGNISEGLTGATNTFRQMLDTKVGQEREDAIQRFNQNLEMIKNNQVTPELLTNLGVSPEVAQEYAKDYNDFKDIKNTLTNYNIPSFDDYFAERVGGINIPQVSPNSFLINPEQAQVIKTKYNLPYSIDSIQKLMSASDTYELRTAQYGNGRKLNNPLASIRRKIKNVDTDLASLMVEPNIGNITTEGVMNQGDVQRFQALSQLLGSQQPIDFVNQARVQMGQTGMDLGQQGTFNIAEALSRLRDTYYV